MQEAFKFYKAKQNEGLFTDLIDCNEINCDLVKKVDNSSLNHNTKIEEFGIKAAADWEVFKTERNLFIIKNPFLPISQRYWIVRCLKSYSKFPNKNNLLESQFNRQIIEKFWENYENSEDAVKKKLKKAFRWTTLGYHYDWTNKIYNENIQNAFPDDLGELMRRIAMVLNFEDYKAEAAIINFYPLSTTLSSHTDHSEVDLESPLISVSLGQNAIFLAGGLEKEEKPIAFNLSSGDIMIMAKESRLIYHAVPKVYKSTEESWNEDYQQNIKDFSNLMDAEILESCQNPQSFSNYKNYIDDVRININVRQVLPKGKYNFDS